jgi:methylthioribose-1-phosphate isomerase
MPPADVPVPTLLTRSVVLEPDRVRILDRRIFPHEVRYVDCRTVDEVALAIEQMVTQSSGPYFAAGAAMVLAAREAAAVREHAAREALMRAAGERLVATRKTNNNIS